jgi:hypothetical protein
MAPPRVFISYAWESDDYRQWVERLATRLRENGIDARLDKWHLQEGSIPDFMNREVRQADKVLVLCSPAYRTKVHQTEDGERVTGSGWEAGLLSSRLFANLEGSRGKGVPILARGSWQEAAPDFLLGEIYIDLSQPEHFEEHYTQLLRRLTGQTSQAPPLGPLPTDLQPEAVEPLHGTVEAGGQSGATVEDAEETESATGDLALHFTLDPGNGTGMGTTVALRVDGADDEPLSAPFDTIALTGDSQAAREIRAIQEGECTADDIQNLGSELWTLLLGGDLEATVAAARRRCRARSGAILQLRLAMPPALEAYPWEALFDFEEGTLATSPATTVVRTLHGAERPAKPRDSDGPLRLLVVIPTGSGLETGTEWEKIQQSVGAAEDRVRLTCLDGRVTPDRLAETLRQGWDVVHFIGHGEVDPLGRVRLRLNSEGDGEAPHWLAATLFAQLFLRTSVQLVVLNCCHGGAVEAATGQPDDGDQPEASDRPDDGETDDGETAPADALGSLGGYLRKAGVAAVVVMRYAIPDSVAADFSRALYHELLVGPQAGRIDLAVQEGRATLLRNYAEGRRARSYITPALYLAPGAERLFALEAQEHRTGVTLADAPIDPRIPPKLVYALENGRCLPVLGPGILGATALRDAPSPPDLRGLARQLGAASQFPDHERITALLDSSSEWLTPVLLERICQHFESVSLAERAGLTEAIQAAYRDLKPSPELLEIASWNLLGLVYTHVDGLLERALYQLRGRNLRVVDPATLEGAGASPAPSDVVLLNLRGNYTTPASLVLTERDEDAVLDNIPEVASFVEDLMNASPGCTLLFLGISPGDPLVRALSRRLLRDEVSRNRGTAYFVAPGRTVADEAYWRFDKLEWVELDLETVLQGLSTAAARAAASPAGSTDTEEAG